MHLGKSAYIWDPVARGIYGAHRYIRMRLIVYACLYRWSCKNDKLWVYMYMCKDHASRHDFGTPELSFKYILQGLSVPNQHF